MRSGNDEAGAEAQRVELWLGYDGLAVSYGQITAVLKYQPVWNRRITKSYGCVPDAVRSVVLISDGRVLPSARGLADLHARWLDWQQQSEEMASTESDASDPNDR